MVNAGCAREHPVSNQFAAESRAVLVMLLQDDVDVGLRIVSARLKILDEPLEDHPSLFSADRNFSQPLVADEGLNFTLPVIFRVKGKS